MKLNESCHNWTLEYNNPALRELDPETPEYQILKNILHLAGDVLDSYNNIPADIDPEVRDVVLEALSIIFINTKEEVLGCLDHAMSAQALKSPLEKGYSEEEVFGVNLLDEFNSILTEPDELAVAAEHFQRLPVGGGVVEDDDEQAD